jgi:hypothetical protein
VLLVVVAVLGTCVRIQQGILRWRAERLLGDIRSIQMGKSTWADAERLMNRWGAWGGYEGSCTEKRCDYQIVMEDAFQEMPSYSLPSGTLRNEGRMCCQWLRWPYYLLGGRFAMVGARIEVKDGIIWTKSVYVDIITFPRILSRDEYLYALAGEALGGTNHRHSELRFGQEYAATRENQCTGCKLVRVDYSPFADPGIVNQLLDFNLDCLTRFPVCREPAQLMPTAWRMGRDPGEPDSLDERKLTEDEKLEEAGRDTEFAAIAEIVGERDRLRWGKLEKCTSLRFVQSLKGGVPTGPEEQDCGRIESFSPMPKEGDDPVHFKAGDRMLVLFDIRPDHPEPDAVANGSYDFVPYTAHNLEILQRGIARDKLADVP